MSQNRFKIRWCAGCFELKRFDSENIWEQAYVSTQSLCAYMVSCNQSDYDLLNIEFDDTVSSEFISEIRSEYNNQYLALNPNVLLIKVLSPEITQYYQKAPSIHHVGDSGLDLYCPETITIPPNSLGSFIHFKIACQANKSFWLLPRSSIGKTPLRMANSIGLIDQGYRGEIMACVDNHGGDTYTIPKDTRLFQLAFPDLSPVNIILTPYLCETSRGAGGFGSTTSKIQKNTT